MAAPAALGHFRLEVSVTGALFSPAWYRVAELKLRLRRHTRIHRHIYRGRTWYVLQDRMTGQFHRFTPEAFELIGRMDGSRTLQQIWDSACRKLGDMMPTQREVIGLVGQLHQANAIQGDRAADIADLEGRSRRLKRQRLVQKLMSPLGLRLPLFDPENFLVATQRYVLPVFSRWGLAAWTLLVGAAILMAAVHWQDLKSNVSDRVLQIENVVLMALVYPVVKTLHELGHAYAVKRWGGEVHEIGVMFLVFYPVPYVDASAATAFRNKRERMVVGAAGIMVEMALAALSLFVWLHVGPGLVRALAADVMIISGVSTLLFNGNPLLRFDAYYVLADFIEIPNLAQRGSEQVAYLAKRYLFGVRSLNPPAWSRAEAVWLAGYAALSFSYRVLILLAISLLMTSRYLFFGGLIAVWSLYMTLLNPLRKALVAPLRDGRLRPAAHRIYALVGGAVLVLLLLLFAVPLPYSTRAEGLVWVEDNAILRAGEPGMVDTIIAQPGSQVRTGQVLLKLSNPESVAHVKVLAAELAQSLETRQAAYADPSQTLIQGGDVKFLQDQLATARQRAHSLDITSAVSGKFLLPGADDLIGRYFRRGERLGFIADPGRMMAVVLVPDDAIDPVRNRHSRAFVRFATARGESVEGRILRITPASDNALPSEVLSTEGGGPFAPDPRARDPLTAFQRFYRVDIAVPGIGGHPVQERVYALFRHDWEPLGFRWYRSLRQLLLNRLNV
jgi:putative peptide zinc metalloprotease protein